MTTAYEVPTASLFQTFNISLAGVNYKMTFKWNEQNNSWILDIADSAGNALVSGVPIITGADLLEQYAYLGINGNLLAQTDHNPNAVPTFENLGSTGHLFYLSPV
jgi:hypothetical protein